MMDWGIRRSIMFHVRRRPADYHPRKRKKKPQQKWNHQSSTEMHEYRYEDGFDRLPFFLELNPDGSDIAGGTAKRHRLHPNVTEVGSERASPHSQSQTLQLFGPNIQPRHCVIAHTEGIVTVTPCSRDAETYVNGQRIYETTILQNGAVVKFGRIHNFRFCDPCHDERLRQRHDSARMAHDYSYDRQSTGSQPPVTPTPTQNYETTFDVDGNVETRSTSSLGNKDETRSQRSVGSSSRDGNRLSNYERYPRGNDPILPAVLELREEKEEALLHELITNLEPNSLVFKLAPAYTLYLAARYRASTHYRPELTPTERAYKLTLMLARVAAMIHNVIQERYCEVKSLALWLANASELLHFLKSDRHVSAFSLDAQDTLADAVQIAFRHLVACLQAELAAVMPNFLSERDELSHDPEDSSSASELGVLASAMALLRRCRVNAALTIQLFSQLFHFINVWAFNRIVAPNSQYCSRAWGLRLKARLAQIEVWAERQGLELAADCHLARIMQAAHLLQAPKYTAEDLATLTSTCFKLNSLQLRALLQKYQPTPDEPRLPHELIDNVVRAAENLADELARSDGREVKLEEDPELALPFLLPEDGYSCEVVRGIPAGLAEFVGPLQHMGLCRLIVQPSSNGLWTVYMGPANPMVRSSSAMSNRSGGFIPTQQQPEIQLIKLHKSNNGMGLSIVAAKGAGQDRLGIYIKSVVKGGAADADGRLQAGDQLLKVDGQSLVGITQEKAAEYLVRTGPVVTLEVAKQGAIYHGLATLLSQPSPVMTRAARKTSLSSLAEEPYPYLNSPPSLSQSCQTQTLSEHLENNIPEIRIEVASVTPNTETNLLTVPVPTNRVKCYKIPPDNDLCLCEDIFQQHQAKLVNCDSEDANAISHSRDTVGQNEIGSEFKNPKADVVRYHKKDQSTEMSPKWLNRSLENITKEENGKWVPLPGLKRCKSDFYLSKSGEWKMADDEQSYKDLFSEEIRVYNLNERQTECYKEILEAVVSSTSTSECSCDNGSFSPKSTDSSSVSSGTLTLKPVSVKGNFSTYDNSPVHAPTSKLSAEERDRALKELDEIVSGRFLKRISAFGRGETCNDTTQSKMSDFLSDMLKLDLSSLKNSSSSESKNNSSSEEEMLQFGCGRVAALAKHFSRMGEAGIIRGRGGPFNRGNRGRGGLNRNSYKSEPNIIKVNDSWADPSTEELIIPEPPAETDNTSPRFQVIFTSQGLHPVGFSMDRLLDIGQQNVVLKELGNEQIETDFEESRKLEDSHVDVSGADKKVNYVPDQSDLVEDIILEGNYENPDTESYLSNPRARGIRFNSWTQTSDSIDLTNEPETSNHSSYPNGDSSNRRLHMMKDFKKMSLSLDSCTKSDSNPKSIDLKKKSISVDEIEMMKSKKPGLKKHYSFVDLGSIDSESSQPEETQEDDKVGVMSVIGSKRLNGFRERRGNFCTSEEISKQYGLKEDILKDKNVRKWLSVDEAAHKSEFCFKTEKLDTGVVKDSLRKIHRTGDGMGRKLKRMKKIDQKMLVVAPWRFSEVNPREGVFTVLTTDEGDWRSRRNSVPTSLLASEKQESISKLPPTYERKRSAIAGVERTAEPGCPGSVAAPCPSDTQLQISPLPAQW
ncbi:uncharacterized protein LOC128988204 isoform X2 [Macrosteles quadrilineatus]|uniref:uncharacterized protein LOC128988204 isoform X2 n=1 Tax=Macrosteles quadrilineatus TaxID=74068 RepID=UPI0023E284E3|nr:uncharacterized protein LOC128988204 isoform X2 [Macrosteles quadrilineatus]